MGPSVSEGPERGEACRSSFDEVLPALCIDLAWLLGWLCRPMQGIRAHAKDSELGGVWRSSSDEVHARHPDASPIVVVPGGLVDPVAADFEGGHQLSFIVQPFLPAAPDGFLFDIGFGELDEQVIVSGFAFHEAAVELPEVVVVEAFAEAFEPFATAGFDEGEDKEAIEKAFFFVGAFFFKFHQLVDVLVLALAAEGQVALLQFSQDEAEMSPFFGYDGGEVLYEALFVGIPLDQRDATGGGFLFAPGVVGEDVFQRDAGEIDPAGVRG
jgi:hypothetical protein